MKNQELERKIGLLREYVEKLAPYAVLDSDDLIKDEEKRAAMERWFQLMVDEAIDINTALTYQLGGKVPESYKSTFYELVGLGILEKSFAEKIAESVKVSNQMIHDYERVQHSELIERMKGFFEPYKKYARIIRPLSKVLNLIIMEASY